ncbi:MAG: Dyp-type peroxidase [Ramlibacter sp.]|nr:Dyp-type peroxidase [Ramlibacter sp.]
MKSAQTGILQAVPPQGRYLSYSLEQPAVLAGALDRLAGLPGGADRVVGLGLATVAALGRQVPGLREMPDLSGHGVSVPTGPVALWCWLRGEDRGDLVLQTRRLDLALAPAFRPGLVVDAFRHGRGPNGHGRDLTGYEDGTENPQGEAAIQAALVQGAGPGLDGSSYVAVQQWQHDFAAFERLTPQQQDDAVGRRRTDNEELDDAPASAHVKRTAQESFEPEAFVLRRSMPWSMGASAGLMFVAFGHSLDAFEVQMRRMAGQDDGVTDALFGFSRPVNGAYLWCPPVLDGRLDLRQLGL